MGNNDQFIFNEPIADKPSNRSKVVTRVSEDFQLTSAEKADLYFLTKKCLERYSPSHKLPKAGFFYAGASWERICAIICLYLLWRDGRCQIYKQKKAYYDEIYYLKRKDFKELRRRVLGELEEIMDASHSFNIVYRQKPLRLC